MKLIAMAGEPAVGKTTIFKGLRERMPQVRKKFKFGLVRGLSNEDMSTLIIGVYDGSTFEGSDKLSMGVQPDFVKLLKKMQDRDVTIYLEGDRLTNASLFRQFPAEGILVRADEDIVDQRHKKRNDSQQDKFIKAKRTKVSNLHEEFGWQYMDNNTEQEGEAILDWLASHAV